MRARCCAWCGCRGCRCRHHHLLQRRPLQPEDRAVDGGIPLPRPRSSQGVGSARGHRARACPWDCRSSQPTPHPPAHDLHVPWDTGLDLSQPTAWVFGNEAWGPARGGPARNATRPWRSRSTGVRRASTSPLPRASASTSPPGRSTSDDPSLHRRSRHRRGFPPPSASRICGARLFHGVAARPSCPSRTHERRPMSEPSAADPTTIDPPRRSRGVCGRRCRAPGIQRRR